MGETELRGNVLQGDGVYKSTDAGKTWTHVGLEKTLDRSPASASTPGTPDVVYVAALGDPYGPNPERGVFKTVDGGKTWRRILFRDDKTGAVDLVDGPEEPGRTLRRPLGSLTHAALAVERRAWQRSFQVNGRRRALDRDHEKPRPAETNLGQSRAFRSRVRIRTRVYAIIEAAEGGVFLSDDAGATWKLVNEDRRLRQRAFYYTRIYADPQVKDTLYILNTGDLPLDGRGQDRSEASACRTATTTTSGSRRTIRSG